VGTRKGVKFPPEAKNYKALKFGPVPVDMLYKTLGLEMDEGTAFLSKLGHFHIATDHPSDYPVCFPLLEQVVADPTYVGQDPKHAGNIIFIRRIQTSDDDHMLVAIGIDLKKGKYHIRSCYLTEAEKIYNRRSAGYLFAPKWA